MPWSRSHVTAMACVQMGNLFGDSVAPSKGKGGEGAAARDQEAAVDAEAQMRRQSGVEIDLQSGAVSACATVTSE